MFASLVLQLTGFTSEKPDPKDIVMQVQQILDELDRLENLNKELK